jgi:restriction system protein
MAIIEGLFILALIVIVVTKLTTSIMGKGWVGEQRTKTLLHTFLDSSTYTSFHDVILPSSNGTSQLDHILVSIYGIFIVETKNKKGWIFGSEDQKNWTQVIYKKKYSFQNPLKQTFRQKKVLSEFLGVDENKIFPVIYFNGGAKFKTPLPANVINRGLPGYVKKYRQDQFSSEEIDQINIKLSNYKLTTNLDTRDHIISLKERHSSSNTCPRCGGHLVERVARKGRKEGQAFLGCENFPKCKFTKNT